MLVEVQVTYVHIAFAKLLKQGEDREVERRSRGASSILMSLPLWHFAPSQYLTRCLGKKIMQ